ncbi:hypothetical protein OAS19_00265 [Altererythrobacter sp.]|nr:hypothetical protein [Altererythrobacter sp.]
MKDSDGWEQADVGSAELIVSSELFSRGSHVELLFAQGEFLRETLLVTGLMGLVAAILVGAGEFLLHFDRQNRYMQGPQYMANISPARVNVGHFLSSLSVPLYIGGVLHLFLMTQGASLFWAAVMAAVLVYTYIVAAIWIGSRATLHTIVSGGGADEAEMLVLYERRYESLLNFARIGVLVISVILAWLIIEGPTPYPWWMAVANPAVLIAASFAIWWAVPAVGKFLMPIALNVAFAIFYGLSTLFAYSLPSDELAQILFRSVS